MAPVFDGERRGYFFAVVADDFGEGPEVFLFFGGNPAFDEDVFGVLFGGKGAGCVSKVCTLFFFFR